MLAPLAKGSEFLSQAISGRFHLDMEGLNRILTDTESIDRFNMPDFATATIDLLSKSGMFGAMTDAFKKKIYAKVVEGVTSAIAMSTIFTMPCYWGCVAEEDYDNAILYVFGEEGSEKREQYAGLIDKIDNYHENVMLQADNLMQSVVDSGVNLGILCKYGFQMVPICEESYLVSDQYVSVNKASFGATTAKIGQPFSDDYVKQAVSAGKGAYLASDRLVDASTCLFPETTWFVKYQDHDDWSNITFEIYKEFIRTGGKLTVGDKRGFARFYVLNRNEQAEVMTAENANCRSDYYHSDVRGTFAAWLAALRALVRHLPRLIQNTVREKAAASPLGRLTKAA